MYVDSLDLRPLDIVLSRARGKPSNLIAHATYAAYSHAAVVVDQTILFDATPDGVDLRCFNMDFDKEPSSWYEGEALEILSHSLLPHLSSARRNELAAELLAVCAGLSGKQYSAFPKLIALARRPWVLRVRQLFPGSIERLAKIAESCLGFLRFIKSSTPQKKWAVLEFFVPSDQRGHRFFCSEAVVAVFEQLGLHLATSPVHNAPVPHDFTDQNRFFVVPRSVVCEGRPAERFSPNSTGLQDKQSDKVVQAMRRVAKNAIKEARRALGPIPDTQRMSAVISRHSEKQTGLQTKHLWTAWSCRDAQATRIESLTRLTLNLSDLVSNNKKSESAVRDWAGAVYSDVNSQIKEPRREMAPESVQILSSVSLHDKAVEALLQEIRLNQVLISQLLDSCGALSKLLTDGGSVNQTQ